MNTNQTIVHFLRRKISFDHLLFLLLIHQVIYITCCFCYRSPEPFKRFICPFRIKIYYLCFNLVDILSQFNRLRETSVIS